jgi:hypothetical protein
VRSSSCLDAVTPAPELPRRTPRAGFGTVGGGGPSWTRFSAAAAEGMAATHAYLYGSKTYEKTAAYWPTASEDDSYAWHLNGTTKYAASRDPWSLVLSRTSTVGGTSGASLCSLMSHIMCC